MKRIIKSKPKLESDEISANPIGRLMNQPIVTEVQNSYLDYAMSVIISRALPDVRDGLKPVHRRILYAMWHMGLKPQAKQRKSATVVGEVLGKYHPHGDVAVYDTLVRLAQDFSMRYPMVMGQGNFGCFTGDTKIKLLDGTEGSFEQLAKDFKPDQKFAVYSVNKESEIIVGLAHHSRITRKNAEIIELTLNTGEKIRCTPDHRFLLNNGTYKSAKKLTIKDILLEQAQTYNHRVVSIKKIKEKFDVWDITVDEYHNFLLADGVFVHNSLDGDSAAAMRYCVTGDTLIPTDKGMIPIEKISENQSEDIQIKILSKNKIINNATKWFDSGVHPTIKITTQHGFTLTGTANHPILTWSKDALTGEPIFQWKLLEKIQENDVAVLDRNADLLWSEQLLDIKKFRPQLKNKRRQIKTLPNKMDENLAHILGALLVEGTIKQNEIEFCNSDSEWIDDFKNRWQKVFPDCRLHCFSRAPNSFGKKPYYTLEIHSRFVVEFLKNLGLEPVKSKEKTVPFTIFQSPKKVAAAFLQAYFEGDGSISFSSKMTELSCCSVSEKLIAQTQLILLRFGITGTKRYDSYRKTHKLYLRGLQNYLAFQQEINFLSNLKTNKLNKAIARIHKDSSQTDFIPFVSSFTRSLVADFPECNWDKKEFAYKHNFDHYPNIIKNGAQVCTAVKPTLKIEMQILFEMLIANNYLFDSIVKIEKGITQKVYSLRVASECHSFVGNGFINHNTECKLANISEEILTDIERDTVNFTPNYDGMHLEPTVLPARLPNLLLNGTIGIAVGMATSIPPHNLGELCSAINHLIEHPDADVEDLTEFVKGPDFPTGGIIYDKKEITQAYATGRGRVVTRAKTEIVEDKNGLYKIIVHEIPYQINKATLVEKIADLVHEKKIEGIKDLRDESNKDGVRIVIELKKDSYPKKVLNQLFNLTQLQETFHLNMLALVDGIQPRVLNLKNILEEYIKHRQVVVRRRTEFDLKKAEERAHILKGLKIALDNIDAVIKTIKKSKDKDEAKTNLMKQFRLTEIQSLAILEMKLQQLANLERQKIDDELKEKLALIKELQAILSSAKRILSIIKTEVEELKTKYADERRTQVVLHGVKDFSMEDLVPNEDTIVMITRDGYIKRLPPETFRTQGRGGKGVIGVTTKEEDVVEQLFTTTTHADLLFFTTKGRAFQLKAYDVPAGSRTSKGQAIVNFLQLGPDEKVSAVLSLSDLGDYKYLVMVTRNAVIKKVNINDLTNIRRSGLIALKLKGEDLLQWVKPSTGADEIMIVTANGQSIRFKEKVIRAMGRNAAGVRGMRLKGKDVIVGMDIVEPTQAKNFQLFIISEEGLGKRTPLGQYRLQGRGGSGIKTSKVTKKTGQLIGAYVVNAKDERDLMVMSTKGQIIRLPFGTVSVLGRATQGVRLMRFKEEGDKVASVTLV